MPLGAAASHPSAGSRPAGDVSREPDPAESQVPAVRFLAFACACNAAAAPAAGKNADAVGKLTDVRTNVQALGATGKLAAEDAARLDAAAAAAIGCIESIGA